MITMGIFWGLLWAVIGALATVACYSVRSRLRSRLSRPAIELDDEAIGRILEEGVLTTDEDEPLDLKHIRQEEETFWEETWDEADE